MNSTHNIKLIIICGPTASGKSELAVRLGEQIGGEIVNADSMQIYRGMDIGTAKPTIEERRGIPHHLIDIVTPDTPFSAADFANAADNAISDIVKRGKTPIITGGTGLYIRALLHGLVDSPSGDPDLRESLHAEAARIGNQAMLEKLKGVDPALAAQLHPNNLLRIIRALEVYQQSGIPLSLHQQQHAFAQKRYRSLNIGIQTNRQELYKRINSRVERMLSDGLLAEVSSLLDSGYSRDLKPLRSIGYKEAVAYLAGETGLTEMTELIKRNTRHYAKRQLTWFNADPDIIWLEYPEYFVNISSYSIDFINQQEG